MANFVTPNYSFFKNRDKIISGFAFTHLWNIGDFAILSSDKPFSHLCVFIASNSWTTNLYYTHTTKKNKAKQSSNPIKKHQGEDFLVATPFSQNIN